MSSDQTEFEIIDSIKTWLFDKGLTHSSSNKYFFKDGTHCKSFEKALVKMGFPNTLSKYPLTGDVILKYLGGDHSLPDIHTAIGELSREYRESNGVSLSLSLGEVDSNIAQLGEKHCNFIRSLVPFMNSSLEGERMYLINPANNRPVIGINPEVYYLLAKTNYETLISSGAYLGLCKFNPYELKSIYQENKNDSFHMVLNLYTPPKWRFRKATPKFHGFIKDLICHLLPIESEREDVLDWIHYSLVSRAGTLLCLIGARGTGKGLLLNEIMTALIGEEFREIVGQSILVDKFNSSFSNKRYLFFDEVNINGEEESGKIKMFCNDNIALEGKGKDAKTIRNYASLTLASNERDNIKVLPQDRRYSIPQIASDNFNTIKSEEEILKFINRIKEEDSLEIAEFGEFLINRKPKRDINYAIKGEYYFEICKMNLSEWNIFLVDYIMDHGVKGEVIMNKEFAKEFKDAYGKDFKWPNKSGRIKSFLWDYRHKGDCVVGEVVEMFDGGKGRKTFGIKPNTKFLNMYGTKKAESSAPQETSAFDRNNIVKE